MTLALTAHALTTLQAVKDELSLGTDPHADDDYLRRKINAYSDLIETFCGRHFEIAALTEKHAAEGYLTILLERTPITALTSISYDGTALLSTDYEIDDAQAGVVRFVGGSVNRNAIVAGVSEERAPGTSRLLYSVAYTGGYVLPKDDGLGTPAAVRTLPNDLEEACILAAATAYRKRGRDRTVQAESLLSWSVTYAGGVSGSDDLPPEAMRIVERYRRIRI